MTIYFSRSPRTSWVVSLIILTGLPPEVISRLSPGDSCRTVSPKARSAMINFCMMIMVTIFPFLSIAEGPDFITLDVLALEVTENLVHMLVTCRTDLRDQFKNSVQGDITNPDGGADRISFNKATNDLCFLCCAEFIHGRPPPVVLIHIY